MQYPSHSKHQIRQYSGYGVSIATYVNGTEYSEVDVAPPQDVEPTENHTLVASREDVTTNNGSTSHGSDLDVECGRNSKRHSEKKSWRTTPRNIAAAVGGGRAYTWYPHGKFEIDAEQDSEEKSWWTTPKKIAAAVGVGLLIGGAAVVSILIATNGANESDNSTQIVVGGGSGSSNSNPTFTTEAMSLDTNGLPSSNGFDDGISTYTPSISTEAPIGVTDLINLLTSEPFKLPTEKIVTRYTTQATDRKYNRLQDQPFDACPLCVKGVNDLRRIYNYKLARIKLSKYCLYRQRLEYNKAFIEDINATLSILESRQEGDSAVHSVRTDLITALQHQKEALMQEQPDLNDRLDQTSISDYHPVLSFQGNSNLHPKIEPGNFTSEEMHHLNRVAAARDRYQLQFNLFEVELRLLGQLEYLASLDASIASWEVDLLVIEQDIRIWSGKLPLEDARSEKQAYETERSNRKENYEAEVRAARKLLGEISQTKESLGYKYPEIVQMPDFFYAAPVVVDNANDQ